MESKILKSLGEARLDLLKQVKELGTSFENKSSKKTKILRLEVPLENAHPLEWLILQDCPHKIFWENRNQKEQFAGIGSALVIKNTKKGYKQILLTIRSLLKYSPKSVRFFGGLRFDSEVSTSQEWTDWGMAIFSLPMIELSVINSHITLACNIYTVEDFHLKLKDLQKNLESMRVEDISIPDSPLFRLERYDIPEYRQWCKTVEKGLENISMGKLKKVVLARTAIFTLARDYDPNEILLQLRRQAPQAFHFCFQLVQNKAFLGITPELLYRRKGRKIESEAIASTRPRGQTHEEDERLAIELLESEKERREHIMVLERMERLLCKFCEKPERLSYLERLPLRHVQHLQSKVEGILLPKITDSDLLPAFHPTPSVSGTPDPLARTLIRELEPFDRGWYAGPVGWIGLNQAEFAVGIRSGLLCGRTLRIFTGAGIVKGSTPEEEWREIEDKLQSWKYLLRRS